MPVETENTVCFNGQQMQLELTQNFRVPRKGREWAGVDGSSCACGTTEATLVQSVDTYPVFSFLHH